MAAIGRFSAPHGPLIIAHRGGAGLAPENSPAAFRNAVAVGADMVELDIHQSRDGALVVIHDASLARTSNAKGPVADKTLDELRAVFLKRTENAVVPTLDDIIDVIAPTALGLDIEIKLGRFRRPYAGLEERLARLLAGRAMIGRSVVSSFDWARVIAFGRQARPAAGVGVVSAAMHRVMGGTGGVTRRALAAGLDGVCLDIACLDADHAAQIRAAGLSVMVYGADDATTIERALGCDVDGVITDRPDLAIAARQRRG